MLDGLTDDILCVARAFDIAVSQEQLATALLKVPPGRSLAGEYIRLCAYIEKLNRQVVRGTELRIAAEQRAGSRNVGKLEERIEQLGKYVTQLYRRSTGRELRLLENRIAYLESRVGAEAMLKLLDEQEEARSR